MITLQPDTIALGERLATLRTDGDQIVADLSRLITSLAGAPPTAAPDLSRSTVAEMQAIRQLLTRLALMTQQARREYSRGDPDKAHSTCEACQAILTGELPIRLRAWSHTEANPDIRLLLDDWIASLEAIQETVC